MTITLIKSWYTNQPFHRWFKYSVTLDGVDHEVTISDSHSFQTWDGQHDVAAAMIHSLDGRYHCQDGFDHDLAAEIAAAMPDQHLAPSPFATRAAKE